MTTTERMGDRRTAALYIAVVMSCEFSTFYSLPDGMPFLVRLTMMAASQTAVGRTLRGTGINLPSGRLPLESTWRRLGDSNP